MLHVAWTGDAIRKTNMGIAFFSPFVWSVLQTIYHHPTLARIRQHIKENKKQGQQHFHWATHLIVIFYVIMRVLLSVF